MVLGSCIQALVCTQGSAAVSKGEKKHELYEEMLGKIL